MFVQISFFLHSLFFCNGLFVMICMLLQEFDGVMAERELAANEGTELAAAGVDSNAVSKNDERIADAAGENQVH